MSEEHVREIILKAFDDSEFRALLLSDPEKAGEGYDLTDVEKENLQNIEPDLFDESLELEERISRSAWCN